MHLDGECACLRLSFTLSAGALTQAGQVLLADCHVAGGIARAGVVHQDLQVHLGLAAEPLDIRHEVALIRPDRAAQRVVVLKRSAETKWQNSGVFEAIRDNAGMVLRRLLVQPGIVFGCVLGDNDGKIAGWEKERLITE
jgi:hypothetical protein